MLCAQSPEHHATLLIGEQYNCETSAGAVSHMPQIRSKRNQAHLHPAWCQRMESQSHFGLARSERKTHLKEASLFQERFPRLMPPDCLSAPLSWARKANSRWSRFDKYYVVAPSYTCVFPFYSVCARRTWWPTAAAVVIHRSLECVSW